MKNNLVIIGFLGLAALVTSSFSTDDSKSEAQKTGKKRHIRLTKIVDGKVAKLDTLVNDGETFVWQGDTVGGNVWSPARPLPPGIRHEKFIIDGDGDDAEVMILRHKMAKDSAPMIWHSDSDVVVDFSPEALADSAVKKIVIHKRLRDGSPRHAFFGNGPDHLPMGPGKHVRMLNVRKERNVIDLSDPNIVSFRKKDLSGGREKIEIIRKKKNDLDRFSMDDLMELDHLVPPIPPIPPVPPVPHRSMQIEEEQHLTGPKHDQKLEEEKATEQNK